MRANPRTSRTLLGVAAGAAITALLAGGLTVPASANPVDPDGRDLSGRRAGDPKPARALPTKWLVQVSGQPALRGGSRTAATSRQAGIRNAATSAGIEVSVLHSYTRVWNGFSVKGSKAQVDKLRSLAGVTAVFPVYTIQPPQLKARPQLAYSLPMIGADTAQAAGHDGQGIKVGVIDTGIDYNHPDLGGTGVNNEDADFPNARVQFGYDLVGDDYDADVPSSTPQPDAKPDDCNGHGTHVAGIVGADGDPAQGGARGVAPEATLGAYRVFGCEGSTDTEVILAAMDLAAADRMDVVNMSLGDAYMTWPGYPTAAAADALTAAGTLVVASVGNEGYAGGLFSSGAPAVGKTVISVASVENTNLSPAGTPNPFSGAISYFSSYGMAADLTLNPDVSAPGGNIWSTYPLEKDGYRNESGTSMAAPHVAGAVALLLQAKPTLKGNVTAVRAALQNTAEPVKKLFDPNLGIIIDGRYEPTIRQGAGLVRVDKAIQAATAGTTVTPGKISLGENRSSYYKTTLKLTNASKSTEKYKLSVVNAVNIGAAPTTYWFDFDTRKVASKFSSSTVTVKAGKTATVSVYLRQPSLRTGWIYGGWVKLTKSDNTKSLVVPFAGMYGDYQKVKVLQDLWDVNDAGTALEVALDLPALAAYDGLSEDGDPIFTPLYASSGKQTFTLSDAESTPHLLFHLDYPVSDLYFNVYKATPDGKKGAEVFSGRKTFLRTGNMGRDNAYLYVPFDGKIPFSSQTSAGLTVPDGDYVLEIRALKPLGKTTTSSHWETFVSPAFTIDRPAP